MRKHGHSANETTLLKVADTLRAAALDEDLRQEIADGCVVKERRAAGLGPLTIGTDDSAPRFGCALVG